MNNEKAAQSTPIDHSSGGAPPDGDVCIQMFEDALRIRMVEDEIVARYPEQEMRCPTHICIGQEGPPVGLSQHLKKSDYVFSAHRSHGHYLAKGGDLSAMIAELYGRETGCARGKGGSQHLVDLEAGFLGSAPILASTISVGVGAAWAAKRRREDRIVVIYFGDGATEEGAFHEAMNFAGVNRLPVVFVCENNLYSVHTPLNERQPKKRAVWELAAIHGALGMAGDGNDLDVVWNLAHRSVEHVRRGLGPVLLELMTYRWKEHCGPNEDVNLGYRSSEEVDFWKKRDPVSMYEKRLLQKLILTPQIIKQLELEISKEIKAAFEFAKASPFPDKSELGNDVYPPILGEIHP